MKAIISDQYRPLPNEATPKREAGLITFFVLTYLITWGIAVLLFLLPGPFEAIFGPMSMSSPIFVVAVAAPTISATILTYICRRWPGLRALYAGLVRWRFGLQWYALVLIGIPLIGYLVGRLSADRPRADLSTPLLVVSFLVGQFILGPLGEELGWRGFALPRLLQRFSPLAASLILGVVWGVGTLHRSSFPAWCRAAWPSLCSCSGRCACRSWRRGSTCIPVAAC